MLKLCSQCHNRFRNLVVIGSRRYDQDDCDFWYRVLNERVLEKDISDTCDFCAVKQITA